MNKIRFVLLALYMHITGQMDFHENMNFYNEMVSKGYKLVKLKLPKKGEIREDVNGNYSVY